MCVEEINRIANSIDNKLVNVRRHLHKNPELGLEEYKTSEYIYRYLEGINIDVVEKKAGTGVIGLICGKGEGPTVALRADIDALPINESSSCEYKSAIPHKMHACGHDVHTACLLGAAEILNTLKSKLNGKIKLIFQPSEEGAKGAIKMLKANVLKSPHVDVCAALHVWPEFPAGRIVLNYDHVFASSDTFEIKIKVEVMLNH